MNLAAFLRRRERGLAGSCVSDELSGVLDRTDLAQKRDLDLAGVGHLVLDALGDVAGGLDGHLVVKLVRINDDADFPAGLNGVGLLDALGTALRSPQAARAA